METGIYNQTKSKQSTIYIFFKGDIVFTVSLLLALASCLVAVPKISYIDFRVLACLFNIMLVVKAFEELHLLEKLSIGILNHCGDSRKVSMVLILMSFFSSMIFTNDVALLTLVPLALMIEKKTGLEMMTTVIFQTLAANIGSSLTPMGNPQNLYIFSFYKLQAWQFFATVGFFTVTGLIGLVILNRTKNNTKQEVRLDCVNIGNKTSLAVWTVVFAIIALSVFRVVDYRIAFAVTAAAALLLDRKLLLTVDYRLLLTFICFFIFIGNVSSIPEVSMLMRTLLDSGPSVYFGSILLSQIISNVPCAILLSGFTNYWKELLLGVNIGGLGTIIASLASVISCKLYISENPGNTAKYMAKFSIYNIVGLAMFTALNYLLVM